MSRYVWRDRGQIVEVFICFRYAWGDPDWCKRHGIPTPDERAEARRQRRKGTR